MQAKILFKYRITWQQFTIAASAVLAGMFFGTTPPSARTQTSGSVRSPDPTLVEDLVAANHILVTEGILDAMGHVSVRHQRNPDRYFLSRSLAPELVTADDIMEFDLDSTPVDGKDRSLYRERFIHGEIYKARPDVKAIVHNHTPAVIAFGVTSVPLRPMYHMAAFVGEGVPVFDIRDAAGTTNMLVEAAAPGRALAQTLSNKPATLMRGHGAVVVGASLPLAVGRSVYLAVNARLQAEAMALGGAVTYLNPDEARAAAEQVDYLRAWEVWKRKATMK